MDYKIRVDKNLKLINKDENKSDNDIKGSGPES
jgi:hypothetical protein